MSAFARRAALQTLRAPRLQARRYASANAQTADVSAAQQPNKDSILKKGARRDPELYTLLAIMTGAMALVGWHFSRNPTSSSSENKIAIAPGSEPWNTGNDAKYQYHPGGDTSKGRKNAPSALNVVVIPDVTLPRSSHERANKWGKEGYP